MTDCDILTASETYEDADMKERRYADTRTYSDRTLLDRSRLTPSDEYYTRRSDVIELERGFRSFLQGRPVFCPFDTDGSAFVQVLREQGYEVHESSDDYRRHIPEMINTPGAIVFSNPPFSISRQIMRDFTEAGIDFILLGHTLRAAAYTRRGYYCLRLWTMTFDTADDVPREIPCLAVSNLPIRKCHISRPGTDLPMIDGKPFFRSVPDWLLAGKPVDVYVCSIWCAYPYADDFEFKIPGRKIPGFYSPIYIIGRKLPEAEGTAEGTQPV